MNAKHRRRTLTDYARQLRLNKKKKQVMMVVLEMVGADLFFYQNFFFKILSKN